MIYSRFGGEFKIIKGDIGTGVVTVKRVDDGKIFTDLHIIELKADGGLDEIQRAIKLNTPTNLSEIGF